MIKSRLLSTLLLLACAPFGASADGLSFDGEPYMVAEVQRDEAGLRNYFLREGETMQRWSRMLRVTDILTGDKAETLARSAASLARMRAPGMPADTFSPEGREESDITVAWLQVADGDEALEYHVVRYVDRGKQTREYGFIIRRYLNGEPVARAMESLGPFAVSNLSAWVAELSRLDRAPVRRKD